MRLHEPVLLIPCPRCGQPARVSYINPETENAVVFHNGCAHFWAIDIPDDVPQELIDALTLKEKEPGPYGISILSVIGGDSEY